MAGQMGSLTVGEILVAAWNAPDDEKDMAWIVCDGFDDQIEIQQAIDEWGPIKLSNGTFTFDEILDLSTGSLWGG